MYRFPTDLEKTIDSFIRYYNEQRYHGRLSEVLSPVKGQIDRSQ